MNELLLAELNKVWPMTMDQAQAFEDKNMTLYLLKMSNRVICAEEASVETALDLRKLENVVWLYDKVITPVHEIWEKALTDPEFPMEKFEKMTKSGSVYNTIETLIGNDTLDVLGTNPTQEKIDQLKINNTMEKQDGGLNLIFNALMSRKSEITKAKDMAELEKIFDEITLGIADSVTLAKFHYSKDIEPERDIKYINDKQVEGKEAADEVTEKAMYERLINSFPDRILALSLINIKNKEDNIPQAKIFSSDDLMKKITLPEVERIAEKINVLDIVSSMERVSSEVKSVRGLNKNLAINISNTQTNVNDKRERA